MRRRVRISKSLLPKPSKIIKREINEIVSSKTGENTKLRDYGKKIEKGKY